MANQEHLEILRQGVEVWNAWRDKEPSVRPDLRNVDLVGADLEDADLHEADLSYAILREANLSHADFWKANLGGADLEDADLREANLRETDLSYADLWKANLCGALLVKTNLVDATLTDCRIYGISAWNVKLNERTKQQGLIITPGEEPEVTVDDLEVAQFVYLLRHLVTPQFRPLAPVQARGGRQETDTETPADDVRRLWPR